MELIYENIQPEQLWMPWRPGWRIWKFRLQNYKVINLWNQIINSTHLIQYLNKFQPIDVWYSSCLFLNPINVRGKKRDDAHYVVADNLFLGTDAKVIDIDEKDTELAKEKVKEFIKYNTDKIIRITKTGGKGYHILTEANLLGLPEKDYHELMDNYVKSLPIEIDFDSTTNSRGVIRLPGTFHRNGTLCRNITEQEIYSPDRTGQESYCFSNGGNETSISLQNTHKSKPTCPSFSYTLAKFFDNKVGGIKDRYIPILSYHESFNYIKDIEKIQNKYRLTTFYLFKSEEIIYAICLRTISKTRFKKILNFSKSFGKASFAKYKKIFYRFTDTITDKGDIYKKKPEYLGLIEKEGDFYLSLPHLKYLNHLGIIFPNTQPTHGKTSNIYVCEMKESWNRGEV